MQEWLVHQTDALGEELLILQKEFDGFDETRERLDLLALDKEGNLVVIENKLDDSGRDVTWQALKYTAYVSTLKTVQIVEIFQKYLDRYCNDGSTRGRYALCVSSLTAFFSMKFAKDMVCIQLSTTAIYANASGDEEQAIARKM